MVEGVYTKCLKSSEDNKNGGPSVVEREGKVNKDFVRDILRCVMLLDDVIDVLEGPGGLTTLQKGRGTYSHCRADK